RVALPTVDLLLSVLCQNAHRARSLGLAEPRKRFEALVKLGCGLDAGPHASAVVAIFLCNHRAEFLHSLRHHSGEPVQRGNLAKRSIEFRRGHRGYFSRVEMSDPFAQVIWSY